MLPVWVWPVTYLGEVSTGWAPTTSEKARMLFFISHLQHVRMQEESYWLSYYRSLVARYGYGAENILSMRVVLADGRVAEVTAEKTEVRIWKTTFLGRKHSLPDPLSNAKHGSPHRQ